MRIQTSPHDNLTQLGVANKTCLNYDCFSFSYGSDATKYIDKCALMTINTQLIKDHIRITDNGALLEYASFPMQEKYCQPMDGVIVRSERFTPVEGGTYPFHKKRLPCFEFVYTLTGNSIFSIRNDPVTKTDIKSSTDIRALLYDSDISGVSITTSSVPVQALYLYILPRKLKDLLGDDSGRLTATIIDKVSYGCSGCMHLMKICPIMKMIIHQIINRDCDSVASRLLLKAKVLELLSYEVRMLLVPTSKSSILQIDDINRLQLAKEVMIENIASPPTLAKLAKTVGLNEKKIKQGFRELFGTTVYGFLREYRMEQAKLMFDRDKDSVSDVSYSVGYSNISHFSTLFKTHYGVLPGEYLKTVRQNEVSLHLLNSCCPKLT